MSYSDCFGLYDTAAANYDQNANVDNGLCYYLGCTDVAYVEYNECNN